uniref:Uncharacterized protein n=1 Tax=Panagrolaimus sp. PS1159 TaxID=55785 RepID=A0AC35FSE6_9BILA
MFFIKKIVRIENNGKIIFGVFKDDNIGIHHMFDNHESWFKIKRQSTNKIRFIKAVFSIPSTPSTVKKMKGVDWYLCLEVDGVLTFKQKACVTSSDYILAEMKSQNKFTLTAGAMTQLTVSFNNVQPIL